MASKIQVSRGSLHAKGLENLLRGELFYVPANANNNKDDNYKDNSSYPYDTGTLYIGGPSINGTYAEPIPIAGERAYKGLVYRGEITSNQTSIKDEMFRYARIGDFYIFKEDATDGQFKTDGFKTGDILIIKDATYPKAPDLSKETDYSTVSSYIKIAGSAGEAKNVHFDKTNSNIDADNVQDAIDLLSNTKINYKGEIPGDYSVQYIMSNINDGVGNPNFLESGSLYLITQDNISFYNNKNLKASKSKKGDLVIWDKNEGWKLIQCGYTDASDIDFDPSDAVAQQRTTGTFIEDNEEHILSTSKLTNTQEAITYLLSHKAMLSSDGKVPLSQLPDTVLGAMQYCGTWDPVNGNAAGVNNPDYQNNWPTGTSFGEDDEEFSSENNNHPGDYYIVKTEYTDINYYDKKSAYIKDENKYYISHILNNGDYIIYTVPRDEKGNYLSDQAHWEVIDNSATITSLNFIVNGIKNGNDYDYATEAKEASIVGNPKFVADGKIVLVQEDEKVTFAGVRLVDQLENDPNKNSLDNYVPVYSGNTNTIKRSTISNFFNSSSGNYEVHTNADIFIGEKDSKGSANAYVYGNIYVNPHFEKNTNTASNSGIIFRIVNKTDSTDYFESTLLSNDNTQNGAKIYLPDRNSDIVGKIKGVTLLSGYLTKSTVDGYIESTSIEEHMSNGSAVSIEFHAPDLFVNKTNTRKIVLGDSSESSFVKGNFKSSEKTSTIMSNVNQVLDSIVNSLPSTSGTLLNDTDWKNLLTGTKGTLPIYGETTDGKNTLIDSKIKQATGSLFDILFQSKSEINKATRTLSSINVDNVEYINDTDADFANKTYGEKATTTDASGNQVEYYKGSEDNAIIESDTVIGEIEKDINGKTKIKTPKSLMVSKSLIIGNFNTNTTHILPGRDLFTESSQYYYPDTNIRRAIEDVYIELPSVSGVLLSDESVIDGGNYTES